jgi:hypothetical protein
MNREEREIDKYHTYNNEEDQVKNETDRPLVLAQEGGYYRAIRNEPSLDSLLGMEGNDVNKIKWKPGDFYFPSNLQHAFEELPNLKIIEVPFDTDLIPSELQGIVLVISP